MRFGINLPGPFYASTRIGGGRRGGGSGCLLVFLAAMVIGLMDAYPAVMIPIVVVAAIATIAGAVIHMRRR